MSPDPQEINEPGQDEHGRPRLELDYPCQWRYRVIVEDASLLRAAVASMLGSIPYSLDEGRSSRAGRYVSMELEVEVRDEEHRHAILAELQGIDVVRFVL